jgi:hypothetical protein
MTLEQIEEILGEGTDSSNFHAYVFDSKKWLSDDCSIEIGFGYKLIILDGNSSMMIRNNLMPQTWQPSDSSSAGVCFSNTGSVIELAPQPQSLVDRVRRNVRW